MVFCQKHANGIANSEDPDQTAPLAQTYLSENFGSIRYERRHEKNCLLVSEKIQPKPSCGYRVEISDLESRGVVLSM